MDCGLVCSSLRPLRKFFAIFAVMFFVTFESKDFDRKVRKENRKGRQTS
jgi:hypothetical protein